MKQTKDLTVLVIDHGIFFETARRMARDCKRVLYYTPWEEAFPTVNKAWIGKGFEEVERVDSIFGEHFDEVDLFVFPDCYFGELQVWLEKQGKAVFGARLGEDMELNREGMKELMQSVGLPVVSWKSIRGMANLRAYLKLEEKVWIKVSKWRGTFETFFSPTYKDIEPRLDDIEHRLGPLKTEIDFLVDGNLPDCVEIGCDAWTVDGEYPSAMLAGIEVKDKGYVSAFLPYKKLPAVVTDFNAAMVPTFASYGYRGFFSTELRVDKSLKSYMIDFTSRTPSPPGELELEFYTNISDIIWAAANGEMIDPEPAGKFGAEAMIISPWAERQWQPVSIPEEFKNNVKLRSPTIIGGEHYVIPLPDCSGTVGAVVGWGETLDDAIEMVKTVAAEVKGYQIEIKTDNFNDAAGEIEKLREFGVELL